MYGIAQCRLGGGCLETAWSMPLCRLLLAGEPLLVASRILRVANCFPTSNILFIAALVTFWHEEESERVVYSCSGASSAVLTPLRHPCTKDWKELLRAAQKGRSEMGHGGEGLASGRGRKGSGEWNLHSQQVAEAPFLGSVQVTPDKPSIDRLLETLVVANPANQMEPDIETFQHGAV